MPTSTLKKIYAKNIALLRFLFSLLVNAFTFFGIIYWKWSFFTVIYLYWAEEVIRIIFSLIENRIEYHKKLIPKLKFQTINKATLTMLFPMFIYFVFIIVIVGIIAAPNHDVVIDNLITILFKNTEFNLNLILAILSEVIILVYLLIKNNSEKQSKDVLNISFEKDTEEYQNSLTESQNQSFSTQMIVLHLSIILGTFLYLVANTDKLPIQIDLGEAGKFAFVIVFATIQTIAEVLVFVKSRK